MEPRVENKKMKECHLKKNEKTIENRRITSQGIGNLIKKSTFGLSLDRGHGFIGVEWKLEA